MPNRNYFACDYCASVHFSEPSIDGVRILDETSELSCPLCGRNLVSADVEGTHVLCCDRCRGILANQWTLAGLIQLLGARYDKPATEPLPVRLEELERNVRCPRCQQAMDVHPYYGPGNIVVDTCPACQLIWLDHGELHRVIGAASLDWERRRTRYR